jgi:hypothetical protein
MQLANRPFGFSPPRKEAVPSANAAALIRTSHSYQGSLLTLTPGTLHAEYDMVTYLHRCVSESLFAVTSLLVAVGLSH